MPVQLDAVELRVLGVLIEKSLTQASSYPLTLNAVVLGSNQKHNREPLLCLTEEDVARALYSLQQKELAAHAATTPGARANRFEHCVNIQLAWDRREQAVMAELMLRGRQTAGELRARAGRMVAIPDLEAVTAILRGLMEQEPPLVEELAREPGRSANRFRHLLGTDGASTSERATDGRTPSAVGDGPEPATTEAGAPAGDPFIGLAQRVERLEQRMARFESLLE
ncbi:MAG: DUF480 domain-containing protein, partial [Phycisphaerae bacterium]